MEQKQDNRYNNLSSYAKELHENNKKRIKISGIVLLLLPVVLGLIRWMTDSDKTVFLMIWVLCMFVLSVYLVSVEYLDHVLQKRINGMSNKKGSERSSTPIPQRKRRKEGTNEKCFEHHRP